jgi:multicomponent Na+:H+ antiporter subunit B
LSRLIHILVITVFAILLVFAISFADLKTPDNAKQFLLQNSYIQTGASNLVTAIYLGYRAFDTLGETIVLIGSVTGVVFIMGNKS